MPGLAYLTVDTPDRRMDVALPATVPLAEALPLLIRHGGADLAQRGLAHGGWVLRRADGAALIAGETLADQGVRDGEVLSLVHADLAWPKIAYDDIAVAVQTSPDRGTRWTLNSSRMAATIAGFVITALGCVAALRSASHGAGVGLAFAGLAPVVLGVAMLLHRGGDSPGASSLVLTGMPIAATAGFLVAAGRGSGAHGLVGAGLSVLVYALVAATASGGMRALHVAGSVAGTGAVLAGLVWAMSSLASAASVTAGLGAIGVAGAPALGVRLSGLPGQRGLSGPEPVEQSEPPVDDASQLGRMVARTDELIFGLLAGLAVVAAGCGVVLAVHGGWPAAALASACGAAFGLRARAFVLMAHRLAGLVAGGSIVAPVAVVVMWNARHASTVPAVLTLAGLITVLTVTLGVTKAGGSPYFARVAEFSELASVAAIVPLASASSGLFQPLNGG